MQATVDEDYTAPRDITRKAQYGLLEDANGVANLMVAGKIVGKCYGIKQQPLQVLKTTTVSEGVEDIEWSRWEIDRLVWSHGASLYFLQGGTIADILRPYLPLACTVLPKMSPEPGLTNVVLADLLKVSSELTEQEVFSLLLARNIQLGTAYYPSAIV